MLAPNTQLILASGSPRRRELIQKLERPYRVETSSVEEVIPEGMDAADVAEYFSGLKAEDVYRRHALGETAEDVAVIGADTVVIVDGHIFGKPVDEADACRMLRTLSGRSHEVRTGVTVLSRGHEAGVPERRSFTSSTTVRFYELEEAEIKAYVRSGAPMDKAGAYGIQDQSALFVERIEGDYYNVVGFPIAAIGRLLRELERETP